MARYLKALVFMVAVVFIAGNAWSSNGTVAYAPEGKGDVLIFPFMPLLMADGRPS
ncbi:MAG: hypothetical protein U5L00_21130 [Desulfovermiculus sp.]|nr:hypothetical protein [Desulfovermiculus sp.]